MTINPYRWGGEHGYYTDSTGRVSIRARTYEQPIARWTSLDPVRADGTNWYVYALNSPVLLNDPSGLKCDLKICGRDSAGIGTHLWLMLKLKGDKNYTAFSAMPSSELPAAPGGTNAGCAALQPPAGAEDPLVWGPKYFAGRGLFTADAIKARADLAEFFTAARKAVINWAKYGYLVAQHQPYKKGATEFKERLQPPGCLERTVTEDCEALSECFKKIIDKINSKDCCIPYNGAPDPTKPNSGGNSNNAVWWMLKLCLGNAKEIPTNAELDKATGKQFTGKKIVEGYGVSATGEEFAIPDCLKPANDPAVQMSIHSPKRPTCPS